MTRYVSSNDLGILAKAYAGTVEKIFLSIFSNEWIDDYLAFTEYAQNEKKDTDLFRAMEAQTETTELSETVDPMLAAKCFFMYAWNLFKSTCAENKIVIGLDQAYELLSCYVPGSKIIWGNLVDLMTELEDFRRMAWNQIADYLDEQENKEKLTIESNIRRIEILINSRLQKTIQAFRPDITETYFAREIKGLIETIVSMKIPCTVEDLQSVFKLKIPNLPHHLVQSINAYEEQIKTTQPRDKPQNSEIEFDPAKITRHLVTPSLEPIECVVSVDNERRCLYIRGEEFKLDYPDFNRALHKILEITPPIFYKKRLNEFLDFMEAYAVKTGVLQTFAMYIFKSYKAHEVKQLEMMNHIKEYDVKWEIRFPILVCVLGMRHTKHIDQRIFAGK